MRPLAISHVNVPARDPAALRAWYVDKLGFRAHGNFLWSAGSLLNVIAGEPIRADWHFGFRVEDRAELEEWVAHLRAKGVEVGEIEGDGKTYATVYVDDPEGNTFEIFHERPPV